jgi:hypothetical protein
MTAMMSRATLPGYAAICLIYGLLGTFVGSFLCGFLFQLTTSKYAYRRSSDEECDVVICPV